MRIDRLITLGVIAPFRCVRRTPSAARLPILMYHSISDEPENDVAPYYRTCTRPTVFAEHMALLHRDGWEVAGLAAGLKKFVAGSTSPHKLVVLTFDDGFRDFHTAAFPVLQRYGFTGTVYLPTAFIGKEPVQFQQRQCLTWSEVRELHEAGIEFGSHTVNHPKLVELGWAEIETELRESKATIEQELGVPVSSFAYPYAFPQADQDFAQGFRQLLNRVGYQSCVTTAVGRVRVGDDPFRLLRLPANSADDDALLVAKLAGYYDWLAVPQGLVKKIKHAARPAVRRS